MNQYDVEEAFGGFQKLIVSCLDRNTPRIRALGGSFRLTLKINLDGTVRTAGMPETDLGDHRTERCILNSALRQVWPKPVGGEGDAEHTFSIDSDYEVTKWTRKDLRSSMKAIYRALETCKITRGGPFLTTFYITANGRVPAAGMPIDTETSYEQANCITTHLAGMRFGRQRAPFTKVSLRLP